MSNPYSGGVLPVGADLPGWALQFSQDFDSPFAQKQFPGDYAGHLIAYTNGMRDSSGQGQYHTDTMSVHDSLLDVEYGFLNGLPTGAAFAWNPSGQGAFGGMAQTYGRYSMRMRTVVTNPTVHYGMVSMLWAGSGKSVEGEVDMVEGGLAGTVATYYHTLGDNSRKTSTVSKNVFLSDWHTYTTEWTDGLLTSYIDGGVFKTTSAVSSVPTTPFRWMIQGAVNGSTAPAAYDTAHVLIDWMEQWAPA